MGERHPTECVRVVCWWCDTVFGSNEGLGARRHICWEKKKLALRTNTINTMVAAGQKCIYSVSMCVFMKLLVMLHMSSSKGQWNGVCVSVCLCVYTMCQTQCLLGVWGGVTDWPHWLAFYAYKIWLTCTRTNTHTWNQGGCDYGLTKTRRSQGSEPSIHTSRVTWTMRFGRGEVQRTLACVPEETEKDQFQKASDWKSHERGDTFDISEIEETFENNRRSPYGRTIERQRAFRSQNCCINNTHTFIFQMLMWSE